MRKRLVTTAALAALIGVAAYSVYRAPWFVATTEYREVRLRLLDLDYAHVLVMITAVLVNAYFFLRLMVTGILVLLGGPTSTRTIAWYTPASALFQAAISLAAAIVLFMMSPSPPVLIDDVTEVAGSWGGILLLGANAGAIAALLAIARDRELARTQTWVDDNGVPKPRRRWIRAAPAERPLVKPPLAATGVPGGDPFRAAPPMGLAAKLVQPPKIEAPRKDDDDAEPPKLLT